MLMLFTLFHQPDVGHRWWHWWRQVRQTAILANTSLNTCYPLSIVPDLPRMRLTTADSMALAIFELPIV